MLTFRNNSDTLIIVLHEIYGINDHIKEVCKSLSDAGHDVVCPDLLDGKQAFPYEREEEAYRYFYNYMGLEASVKRVVFLLRQEELEYKRVFLLGYSVGATTAWICCGKSVKLDGMIGFYGSRIREYTEIMPKCPTLLIFPEKEKSFDPGILRAELEKKNFVEVHIMNGEHGFADPYSENYTEASADEANLLVKDFLKKQTEGT